MKKVRRMGKIWIGTSGWMYKDWGKKFYPKGMKKGFLEFLSREFTTVEINSSFYHLPRASTFMKWRSETPSNFIFSVKLSRFITHQKRLIDCQGALKLFLHAAKNLRKKFGVVLIQLPPSMRYESSLLKTFLKDLAQAKRAENIRVHCALEPRHISWMEEDHAREVRLLLKKNNIALVFPHSDTIPSFQPNEENILSNFVYVRFHGPSEFAASRYGIRRLTPWAKRIRQWCLRGLTVYVYFNNDVHGHAIDDARILKRMV